MACPAWHSSARDAHACTLSDLTRVLDLACGAGEATQAVEAWWMAGRVQDGSSEHKKLATPSADSVIDSLETVSHTQAPPANVAQASEQAGSEVKGAAAAEGESVQGHASNGPCRGSRRVSQW